MSAGASESQELLKELVKADVANGPGIRDLVSGAIRTQSNAAAIAERNIEEYTFFLDWKSRSGCSGNDAACSKQYLEERVRDGNTAVLVLSTVVAGGLVVRGLYYTARAVVAACAALNAGCLVTLGVAANEVTETGAAIVTEGAMAAGGLSALEARLARQAAEAKLAGKAVTQEALLAEQATKDAGTAAKLQGNTGGANNGTRLATLEVDVSRATKGTPEYNILNNPPPNTRVTLNNGTEFKTNTSGYVDEITFTPSITQGVRDARQTAVGKEGLSTDVGGHVQACSMGGTCDRYNLFPQNGNFNNSAYKRWENEIKGALNNGDPVGPITVRFLRSDPSSARPDSLVIDYSISGIKTRVTYRNEAGQ